MIVAFLERMRERPRNARRRFVFMVAVVATVVVVIIWMITIPMRYSLKDLITIGDMGSESLADLSNVTEDTRSDLQQLVDMKQVIPEYAGEVFEQSAGAFAAMESMSSTTVPGEIASSTVPVTASTTEPISPRIEPQAPPVPPAKKTVIIATTTSKEKVEKPTPDPELSPQPKPSVTF